MIGTLGLLAALGLLIFMALRGINVILAALICALVVIVTNALPFAQTLSDNFVGGPLGFFSFAGRFFLLFAAGAMFGKIMGESHAATSIAMALANWLGAHRVLYIIVIASAALTYGGVVVFVVIFAMYPLSLRLMKEADAPKRLLCGALALGAGTFTLTALPGTPSINNVIPTVVLGTDLFAGALLGLIGAAIMFVLGMWYLESQRKRALAAGEGFEPSPNDVIPELGQIDNDLPRWQLAVLPLVLVIGIILSPRLLGLIGMGSDNALMTFALSQPILWPSIALFAGCLASLAMFPTVRSRPLQVLGAGMQDSILPLMATGAVIGFGGVVVNTQGFSTFAQAVVGLDLPPLLSLAAAVSVVAGITGSAAGGIQIFMQTLSETYLSMGIEPAELHRIAVMASGGFDSLPHCGAIIAMLMITGLTHKQAYKDVGVVTVVIPVIATLVAIGVAMAT